MQNLNKLMSEPVGAPPVRKQHVAPKAATESQLTLVATPSTAANSLSRVGRFSFAALPTAIANQDEHRHNLMDIFRVASATLSQSAHAAALQPGPQVRRFSQMNFLNRRRTASDIHPNNLMDTFRAASAATPFTSRTVSTSSASRRTSHITSTTASVATLRSTPQVQRSVLDTFRAASAAKPLSTSQIVRNFPSSSTSNAVRQPSHIISATPSVTTLLSAPSIKRKSGVEITVLDDAPATNRSPRPVNTASPSQRSPLSLNSSQRIEVARPQNTTSTTVVAHPFPIDTEITPSLSRPRDTTITSTASLGTHAIMSATITPSNIRQSAVTIAAPLGNRLSANVSVVPSNMQRSAVTMTTPISTSTQGVTSVGLTLNPIRPTLPQLTLMHAFGSTSFGTTLPARRNQRPDINFSRPIPGVGHVGGIINVRKPLQSTLTAQIPVVILGVPVSIGIDLSLRKFTNSRIHLSVPVQPLNFLLEPLGIKVPELQIASISVKKVAKVVKPVFKVLGKLLGFGRCKFSPEDLERIRLALEAYLKDVAEVRAKRQQLLRFPKDIEELGRLVTELQSIVNELSIYAISDKNVRDIGNAAQDLREVERSRQEILGARPAIQESENAVNAAAERLTNQVATLPANLQIPTESALENLRQEQRALSAVITQPSAAAAVTAATAINRTLQENNAAIAANTATITAATATVSQIHNVLQENRSALVQRLRTRLTPEQARALQTRLG